MPILPSISRVSPEQIVEVIDYALRARLAMFAGRVDARQVPDDLRDFAENYLHERGCFLQARDADGRLLGCIAYRAYDGRFAQLDYRGLRVVEVVRLFIEPECRRGGLATALFQALRTHAEGAGVQLLYLHTHPFLPGAMAFWERQGLSIVAVDDDVQWQTTHMQLALPAV